MHGWKDAGGAMVEAPKPSAAQQGLVLYAAHCATCHQSQGAGLAGHFPPLAGDAVVNSPDHTALTSIILKGGRGGKINGKTYPGEMPAFAGPLLDSEVATLETYIRSHWDRLGRGESDTVPFVIPSRLGTLKFSVKRVDDAVVEGRPARQYRLSLASWIGFALPHIDVAYDARSRSLLRFVGLANVHASNGDNVRARIEFDPADERPATPADLMQARQAPLDGRCSIP